MCRILNQIQSSNLAIIHLFTCWPYNCGWFGVGLHDKVLDGKRSDGIAQNQVLFGVSPSTISKVMPEMSSWSRYPRKTTPEEDWLLTLSVLSNCRLSSTGLHWSFSAQIIWSRLHTVCVQSPAPPWLPFTIRALVLHWHVSSSIPTTNIRSERHLTVVHHWLSTWASESSTKATAVHLRTAKPPLTKWLQTRIRNNSTSAWKKKKTNCEDSIIFSQKNPHLFVRYFFFLKNFSSFCSRVGYSGWVINQSPVRKKMFFLIFIFLFIKEECNSVRF